MPEKATMDNYSVYRHIFPNGKMYVGITCRDPLERWGKDGYSYRQQPKVYRAIKKYGWDNIKHEVLYENLSKDDAEKMEVLLIAKHDSVQNGYNVENGGSTKGKHSETTKEKISLANKGKPKSEETKKKISLANKGKKRTPEQKERLRAIASKPKSEIGREHIRQGKLGCKNPNYGKHMTAEAIYKRNLTRGVKKVYQYDKNFNLIKAWESASVASKTLGIQEKNIRRSCTTKYHAGGYKWLYCQVELREK